MEQEAAYEALASSHISFVANLEGEGQARMSSLGGQRSNFPLTACENLSGLISNMSRLL